jgi:nucleoside transporter
MALQPGSDVDADWASPLTAPRASVLVTLRLSVMMFLQYAVWGAWLPVASSYLKGAPADGGLGFGEGQVAAILGLAGSIGALFAPFIAGQFADRYFRTERFLAFLLLLGGVVKWYTALQTSYPAWLWLSIAYSIIYMPTLALSNSLAFAHIRDAARDFPLVRLWGTIGWIAASWAFPMIYLQHSLQWTGRPPFLVGQELPDVTRHVVQALKFSALISFGYAAYCLTLPATPPRRDAVEPLAFAKAFRLLKRPSFALLVLTSLVIAAVHQVYFIQAGPFLISEGLRTADVGPAMTIGQFAEIAMMAGLGLMLKGLGFRGVMVLGIVAYAARYAIWGTTALPIQAHVVSQALHGLCYACFFAASYIYVDRLVDPDARHSAQAVYGMTILGGGPLLGGWLSGWLGQRFTHDGTLDYSGFWYAISAIALITAMLFGLLFRAERRDAAPE